MIPEIHDKEEEVRDIWSKRSAEGWKLQDIFFKLLHPYFDTTQRTTKANKEWMFFMRWVRKWKKENRENYADEMVKNLDDEEIEETMAQNRKKMIVLLSLMLKEYGSHPEKLRGTSINEINRLYRNIKAADEAAERTRVQRGKLGLEAAKTFLLQYNRMPVEELKKLKEKLNASFDRVIQLKAGESDAGAGQAGSDSRGE